MNVEAYNKIIDVIEPLLFKKNMKAVDEEGGSYYINDTNAVKVTFTDTNNTFNLMLTDAIGGKPTEDWTSLSQWIFLDDYSLDDATSIGNDFYDTLNDKLGLKKTVSRASDIKIDGDAKSSMSLEGLAQRFITIFPQYKETYKAEVETYGQCLYIDFFEKTAVECLKNELAKDEKKHLKKFFDLLNEFYTLGDKNAAAVVSAVILKQGIVDEKAETTAMKYMEEYNFLKTAYINIKTVKDN